MREAYAALDKEMEALRARYDEGVLELDLEGIAQRMGTVHRSPLRWLRSSYRRDIRLLKGHRISLQKPSLEEAAADVAAALAVKERMASVAALEWECSRALGEHFIRPHTTGARWRAYWGWCDSTVATWRPLRPPWKADGLRRGVGQGGLELRELERTASLTEGSLDGSRIVLRPHRPEGRKGPPRRGPGRDRVVGQGTSRRHRPGAGMGGDQPSAPGLRPAGAA